MSASSPCTDPLYRLGRVAYSRRWMVVVLWLAVIGVAVPFAPGASRSLSPGGFSTSSLEAAQASTEIQRALGENPAAVLVIFHDPTLRSTDPAYYRAVDD